MSIIRRGLFPSPLPDYALEQKSYSTDAQAVKTVVARPTSTVYLTLNSKDRFQTSSTAQSSDQPWNKFRLQRPQNLLNAFATRIGVSEIRFPFYIPNVNASNNKIWITAYNTLGTGSLYQITVNPGFYSGVSLATALTSIIQGASTYGSYVVLAGANAPFSLTSYPFFLFGTTSQMIYDPTLNNLLGSILYAYNPATANPAVGATPPTEEEYNNNPSLCSLMGFAYQQVCVSAPSLNIIPFAGRITTMTYTDYIDIVSDKLSQYAKARDGSSDSTFNRSLICRLYLSDEAGAGLDLTQPFTIYRQFKNPKMVEWNKEASIDWIDISLYDEYGELLPLPADVTLPNGTPISGGSYPDFQLTLLCTQD
jgi:hypothetical protein